MPEGYKLILTKQIWIEIYNFSTFLVQEKWSSTVLDCAYFAPRPLLAGTSELNVIYLWYLGTCSSGRDREGERMQESFGQGLSWRYHSGSCLVWMRKNPSQNGRPLKYKSRTSCMWSRFVSNSATARSAGNQFLSLATFVVGTFVAATKVASLRSAWHPPHHTSPALQIEMIV